MEVTGLEVVKHFKEFCKKSNKLFIPDSPRQESVADAIAEFYKKDDLFNAIELFIKSKTGPFLIFDFAVESRAYVDKVKLEKSSSDKFKNLVEETRKRMVSE
jgi:hypothetical protein